MGRERNQRSTCPEYATAGEKSAEIGKRMNQMR